MVQTEVAMGTFIVEAHLKAGMIYKLKICSSQITAILLQVLFSAANKSSEALSLLFISGM